MEEYYSSLSPNLGVTSTFQKKETKTETNLSFKLANKANSTKYNKSPSHNTLHSHSKYIYLPSYFFSHTINEAMRETMERFSILPFSIGCVSHSSVEVIDNHPKKTSRESNPSPPSGEGERLNAKPNISEKLQKIVNGFKSLPQVFYREEEEEVMEMEIGFPTDVQHVGHIGWDGSNNTSVSTMESWDTAPDQFMPFPSLSSLSGASI